MYARGLAVKRQIGYVYAEMTAPALIRSLDQVLAPVTPEAFLAEYRGRKPLHVPGAPGKFASVMSWEILSGQLNQTSIWSRNSLNVVLDGTTVPPRQYCRPAVDRDGRDYLMVELELLLPLLRRGASLVTNDIADLGPGLKAAARTLEADLGGKAQANLYCSWLSHQGFGSHFDTHEVYVLHVAGEKTWNIYGKHFDDPVAHTYFKTLGDEFHEAHKGPITLQARLKPGDLLYLPRGWYHDALASSEATLHVAFGLTTAIGLDLVSLLFERAVHDPLCRASLPDPRPDGGKALREHLAKIGQRLAGFTGEAEVQDQARQFVEGFRYARADIALPDDALSARYKLLPGDFAVRDTPQGWALMNGKRGVPIPEGFDRTVAWIVARPEFDTAELDRAFPGLDLSKRQDLLAKLAAMKVIEVV